MRILHVVESFASGTFSVATTLAEGAAEAGHGCGIAYGLRPETPPDARRLVDARVELHPVAQWSSRRPAAQAAAGRRLRAVARAFAPDVIHLHSSFAGAVGALALRGRAPLVYTPHGYSFTMADRGRASRAAYLAAERLIARRVALVGAVSEAEAALARERVRAPRVVAVPNGLADIDAPPPPRPPRVPPTVVAGGRVGPARDPHAAARILGAIGDLAAVRWLGAAPEGSDADAPLRAAGIPVSGWLAHDELLDELSQAAAYLHYSAWDGLPIAVLEAMARDVPVVASDLPANRELLGEENVARSTDEAIAQLRRILLDPAERERRLGAQRERRTRFGAARMVADWLAVYADLAQGAPGGRR